MNTWWNRREGFTLVELLVVIAIIGILATLLILQLGVARQRARDVQRIAHITQIQTALEFYFDSEGHYPNPTAGEGLVDVARFMQGSSLPLDPTTEADYNYVYISNVQYYVWAELEQKATAHNSDLDRWEADNGAGSEVCADSNITTDIDCVYDVGQVN